MHSPFWNVKPCNSGAHIAFIKYSLFNLYAFRLAEIVKVDSYWWSLRLNIYIYRYIYIHIWYIPTSKMLMLLSTSPFRKHSQHLWQFCVTFRPRVISTHTGLPTSISGLLIMVSIFLVEETMQRHLFWFFSKLLHRLQCLWRYKYHIC